MSWNDLEPCLQLGLRNIDTYMRDWREKQQASRRKSPWEKRLAGGPMIGSRARPSVGVSFNQLSLSRTMTDLPLQEGILPANGLWTWTEILTLLAFSWFCFYGESWLSWWFNSLRLGFLWPRLGQREDVLWTLLLSFVMSIPALPCCITVLVGVDTLLTLGLPTLCRTICFTQSLMI